jgi:SAM-dependent methyltransferase
MMLCLVWKLLSTFPRDDGERYIAEAARVVRPGGVFIGTSYFPVSRDEALAVQRNNPAYLHIFTSDEMLMLLRRYFSNAVIIGSWMFIAVR